MKTESTHTITQKLLSISDWTERMQKHESEVADRLDQYLKDRSRHIKEPVMDFLFEYYAFRPASLRKWSPGLQYALSYAEPDQLPSYIDWKLEDSIAVPDLNSFPDKRISSIEWILEMLRKSRDKKPSFACFGMHEWAMVYKAEAPRHDQIPLRMNRDDLAEFVESRPLLCTHFDAFRFFTPEARPMNRYELSRNSFADTEQPGCIHTNMDLYKWAFKSWPWISSELILKAFDLAYEARVIDMKASPYDLSDHGLEPIKIETEEGRKIYKKEQEAIFSKGMPVREQLIHEYEHLLRSILVNREG